MRRWATILALGLTALAGVLWFADSYVRSRPAPWDAGLRRLQSTIEALTTTGSEASIRLAGFVQRMATHVCLIGPYASISHRINQRHPELALPGTLSNTADNELALVFVARGHRDFFFLPMAPYGDIGVGAAPGADACVPLPEARLVVRPWEPSGNEPNLEYRSGRMSLWLR